jgi:hypothetical protein
VDGSFCCLRSVSLFKCYYEGEGREDEVEYTIERRDD